MSDGPNIAFNPMRIGVGLLVFSYAIGEFIIPKYPLFYAIKLIGILGLISSTFIFISGFNIFKSCEENPEPTSTTNRLIKTGIFAYTRNPIYLSLVLFHLSMFLVFENVMYLLSAVGQTIWIHNYIIKFEEEYLLGKFTDEYQRYMNTVSRWLFF